MQQGDAGRVGALHLGHEDEGAPVRTTTSRHHLTLDRDAALRAPQTRVALGARFEVAADAAPIDDRDDRLVSRRVAVDAIPREPDDGVDRGIERAQLAQGAVAEAIAGRAGVEHRLHEGHREQRLVRTGDADGDRLGLVLDRVDGTRELLDHAGERLAQVFDDCARRAHTPVLHLIRVERHGRRRVPHERCDPHRRAGLEVSVIGVRAQPVEEPPREGLEPRRQPPEQRVVAHLGLDRRLDHRARLTQRASCASMARAAS